MKCQANKTKWIDNFIETLPAELNQLMFTASMKCLYRSYDIRMMLAEYKEDEFEFDRTTLWQGFSDLIQIAW